MHRDIYQKGVVHVDSYGSCTDDDEVEIGLAEWTKNKRLISYPWVKTIEEKVDFDITKADQIFVMFLEAGNSCCP
jgi:hypothetical protein